MRPICCMRVRPASSARVGSMALDLSDCMDARRLVSESRSCARGGMADARRGGAEQILDRQVRSAELGHHAPAIEDDGAVADLGDLLEIGRYDDDGGAGAERYVEEAVDLG